MDRVGLLASLRVYAHHLGIVRPLAGLDPVLRPDKARLAQKALLGLLRLLIVNFESCQLLSGTPITCLRLPDVGCDCVGVDLRVYDARLRIYLRGR